MKFIKKQNINEMTTEQLNKEIKKANYKCAIYSNMLILATLLACSISNLSNTINIILSLIGTTIFILTIVDCLEKKEKLNNKIEQLEKLTLVSEKIIASENVKAKTKKITKEATNIFQTELSKNNLVEPIEKCIKANQNDLEKNISFFKEKYQLFNTFDLENHNLLSLILFYCEIIDNLKFYNAETATFEALDEIEKIDMILTLNCLVRKYDINPLEKNNKIEDIINLIYLFKSINPKDYSKNKDLVKIEMNCKNKIVSVSKTKKGYRIMPTLVKQSAISKTQKEIEKLCLNKEKLLELEILNETLSENTNSEENNLGRTKTLIR